MERGGQSGLSLPSTEDIRRKLEGQFEVLEAARESYGTLLRLLAKRNWLLLLHTHLTLLREMLHREPLLDEALRCIHRRARMEDWPETLPALVTAREVETFRERLAGLARRYFGEADTGEVRLAEVLGRLERLALTTLAAPLLDEQEPIQTGRFALTKADISLLWFGVFLMLVGGFVGLAWLGIVALRLGKKYLNSGRYQVTPTRLLWYPRRGTPIQVPLHAIDPRGVHRLSGKKVCIRLWDGPFLTLPQLDSPKQLVNLLRGELGPPPRPFDPTNFWPWSRS